MDDLKTGVDDLLKLVKEKNKIELAKASKILKIPQETLQIWVDYLTEEKILKLEYKLTTPIIVFSGENKSKNQSLVGARKIKQDYMNNLNKKLSQEEKEKEWQKYAISLLEEIKVEFFKESHLRSLHEIQDYAWQVFSVKVIES